ncbi:MAG: hypothetical protein Q8784_01350 [Vigna little leaf phytoplasma]|nr:hypothetical protein [Vigna little leaf phytoplasma]
MSIYFLNKLNSFFRNIFLQKNLLKNKKFKFIIIFITIICLFGILSWRIDRDCYKGANPISFDNVFKDFWKNYPENQILKLQIEDTKDEETTLIMIKAMFIGIIIGICICLLKKDLSNISLGTFLGSLIGIWIAIRFPNFIYFLELIKINFIKI